MIASQNEEKLSMRRREAGTIGGSVATHASVTKFTIDKREGAVTVTPFTLIDL